MSNKIIELININKFFYDSNTQVLNILENINISIFENDKISITGESGSGKSTLLHIIGSLDNPSSGEIILHNNGNIINLTNQSEEELSEFRNKKIGFIFQSHLLIEELNVLDNVTLPYLINDFNKKKAKEHAISLLEEVGLKDRIYHAPSKLSGGEKQRVAIARALINNPDIILADEPTGNLDNTNAEKICNILFDLTNKHNRTLIIVTHSEQIANLANRKYILKNKNLISI